MDEVTDEKMHVQGCSLMTRYFLTSLLVLSFVLTSAVVAQNDPLDLGIPEATVTRRARKDKPKAEPSKLDALVSDQARPGQPWPGPRGPFVFIEAESCTNAGAGWSVVDSTEGKRDELVASGLQALSGAGKGMEDATFSVDLPQAGDYILWVRRSEWVGVDAAGNFGLKLRMSQAGSESIETLLRDSASSADKKRRAYASYRWDQVAPATQMKRGPAQIAMSKFGSPTAGDPRRRIDCFLLTTDETYKPDYRDFAPQTYVRVRVDEPADAHVKLYHPITTRMPRSILTPELLPGNPSPWVNLSRMGSGDGDVQMTLTLQPEPAMSKYTLEFATAPREDAILKRVDRAGAGARITLSLPPALTRDQLPGADFDLAKARADLIPKLPVITFGQRPKLFPMMADARVSPPAQVWEDQVLAYCGINARTGLLTARDIENGFVLSRLYNSVFYPGPGGLGDPDISKITQDITTASESVRQSPNADRIRQLKLIDEAGPSPLSVMAANELTQALFKQWMAQSKNDPFTAADRKKLAASGRSPESVTQLTADRDCEFPGMYYFSQRYRAWSIVAYFLKTTEIVHQHYPSNALSTQNFSDGAVYGANMYLQGNDYFDYFKNKALDLAMSEDWTNAGATRQLCGWNVALLRSATKYHNQPIHMYDIAYSSRRPVEVKLKAMSNIAQGAKLLNIYAYSPRYTGEAGWSEVPTMLPAVAELSREIGAAEQLLIDAMPVPAQTAIIYSIPTDIWSVGHDSSAGFERMYTYLALRHAQVAVDVISDEDARGSWLQGKKVAYLFGEQFDPAGVPTLTKWVQEGGTLVLGAGAASRDQFNQPSDALDQALNIKRNPLRRLWEGRGGLSMFETKGTVRLMNDAGRDAGQSDLIAASQSFPAATGARVLARSGDDAMAVSMDVGKGRVVAVGFMPALSYVQQARTSFNETDAKEMVQPIGVVAATLKALDERFVNTPVQEIRITRKEASGGLPFRYDPMVREFIVAPAMKAKLQQPVQLDAPLVEATLLEGQQGWVIPLANYTTTPIQKLTVTVRPSRASAQVQSSRAGPLQTQKQSDGSLRVELPLESTDFVFARWADK